VLLLCTLAITPLRKFTGLNWLIRFRRLLGLFAFFYVTLHFGSPVLAYLDLRRRRVSARPLSAGHARDGGHLRGDVAAGAKQRTELTSDAASGRLTAQ